jgi:hypothetical protein
MRMTRWAFLAPIVAIGVLALPVLAQSPASDWRTYRYPEAGMAVEFPQSPVRKDSPVSTTTGPVATVIIYAKDGSRLYFTSISDVAAQLQGVNGAPSDFAKAVIGGAVEGRTVVSPAASITVGAGAGWEATSNDATMTARTRVFVANGRAYTVMVFAPLDHPELVRDAYANRFFDSLTLYPPRTR